MGLISRSLGVRAFSLEDPAQPLLPLSALQESLGLGRSDAGVLVNNKQALRLSPVFACFKIISEDLSKIPFSVYQRMPDFSVRVAPEHRVHKLLHDAPNPIMTAMTFRSAFITSALGFGAAFAFIQRDNAARVIALHPLPSDRTTPAFINGEFFFVTTATTDGKPKLIDPENVLHMIGLTEDGITGYSPVTTCKNAVGIAIAAEKFAALFYGNGARATGVLSHPEHLDPEAYENLKKSVREWATGENAMRPIVLEEGLKWEQITINPNDGQMLETRKFQVEEIARLYRVPLHKLGELSRSTNNNIEHQGIEHNQDALQPWAVRFEQEVNRKLLSGNYFAEHDFSELERGDAVSQASSIQTLRNIGLVSTNEGRRKLRLNPISTDDGGDIRIVQGANIPLSALVGYTLPVAPGPAAKPLQSGQSPDKEEADAERGESVPDKNAEAGKSIRVSYRRLFRDAVGRSINRSGDAAFVRRALHPVLAAMCEAINVLKHDTTQLSDGDEQKINTLLLRIISESNAWQPDNAADTASRLTEECYAALEG
jgi:HK97 family phage portal protein